MISSYGFVLCFNLSCRVLVVQEVWGLRCVPPPSNITIEVKEMLFKKIILVTQHPEYFPEFLCFFWLDLRKTLLLSCSFCFLKI